MLGTRVVTAALLLLGLGAALFLLPSIAWSVLVLLVLSLAGQEWGRLCGWRAAASLAYALALAALVALLLWSGLRMPVYGLACLFWVIAVPLFFTGRLGPGPLLLALAGGLVLVPAGLALADLREPGPGFLLAVMAVVWVADSAAYFAGRAFGRRKLAPAISPGKTWEGVAGAYIGVSVYGVIVFLTNARLAPLFATPGAWVAGLAALWFMTALSIVGDLFESWVKRRAGVKDSGRLLPGHGGVLDRVDALTAALPFAALALAGAGL